MAAEAERALDTWPDWGLGLAARPRIVRRLEGGSTNRCWELTAGGRRLVLRLGPADTPPYGLDRAAELRALAAAGPAGLAPAVLWHDAAGDRTVFDYVHGRRLSSGDTDAAASAQLLDTLARVHALDARVPARCYGDYYLGCLRRARGAGSLPADLAERLARLAETEPVRLVHHDPGPGNVVFTESGAVLLDWEYAAAGWPAFDYAVLVVDWAMPAEAVTAASGVSTVALEDACTLYRALCGWWAQGLGGPAGP